MTSCLNIYKAEVHWNFTQNFTLNFTVESDFVPIIKSNFITLFMSMVEVYIGSNLNCVNAFCLILKYHALLFCRDLKIFNEDNTAVIISKISIQLRRVISEKRNIRTRIHCVSITQRYINAAAGDTQNNYSALNDWPQILYRSLSILTIVLQKILQM
jgi:hypothetical protein